MRRPRSARDRLGDILDAIEKARLAVGNMDIEEFPRNWLHQYATERTIEIMSEASRHIPDSLKATEPDIPWRDIADMGNVVRHGYETVRNRLESYPLRSGATR